MKNEYLQSILKSVASYDISVTKTEIRTHWNDSRTRVLSVGAAWLIVAIVTSVNSYGQVEESSGPLPFDDAFELTVGFADEKLYVRWKIEKGYYLYQHAMDLSIDGESILPKQVLPEATKKDDIVFGNVLVYYDHLEVVTDEISSGEQQTVLIKAQGCQEDVFCYTPRTRTFLVESGKVRELVSQDIDLKKFE